jgi:hypothetical protein
MVDLSANELCVPQSGQLVHRPRERATEFLRKALSTEPRPVEELQKLAAEYGVSWRMLERVKQELGVISERARGLSGWAWRLPSQTPQGRPPQASQLVTLGELLALAAAGEAEGMLQMSAGNRPSG